MLVAFGQAGLITQPFNKAQRFNGAEQLIEQFAAAVPLMLRACRLGQGLDHLRQMPRADGQELSAQNSHGRRVRPLPPCRPVLWVLPETVVISGLLAWPGCGKIQALTCAAGWPEWLSLIHI